LERELECSQQRLAFFVGLGGGGEADVHATQRVDLVVLDLGKNDLLFDADVVVATAIERATGDATEVAHTGQRDRDKAIEEFIHAHAAQSHHAADGHAVADLETGDGLLRLRDHGLLAGDLGEVAYGVVHDLLVGDRFAHTHVQGDLGEARHLHHGLVAELLDQFGNDL